LNPRSG